MTEIDSIYSITRFFDSELLSLNKAPITHATNIYSKATSLLSKKLTHNEIFYIRANIEVFVHSRSLKNALKYNPSSREYLQEIAQKIQHLLYVSTIENFERTFGIGAQYSPKNFLETPYGKLYYDPTQKVPAKPNTNKFYVFLLVVLSCIIQKLVSIKKDLKLLRFQRTSLCHSKACVYQKRTKASSLSTPEALCRSSLSVQ